MIDNSINQLKAEVVIPEVSRTEISNEVFNLQKCIAKAENAGSQKGLSRLERYEVKVSRTVLRGGSDGNVTLLPGAQALNSRVNQTTFIKVSRKNFKWRSDSFTCLQK
jgi:hypothetical protein